MFPNLAEDPAFSLASLTAAINTLPFVPGQVGASGLFSGEGVATTSVMIEKKGGSLSLVEDKPRGAPGSTSGSDKRSVVSIPVPHFPLQDSVLADETQNVRAFGSEAALQPVQVLIGQKQARHARDLDTTAEYLRVGAIKGIINFKSGETQNLYTLFGVTAPAAVTWNLADEAFKSRVAASQLKNAIEDDLEATSYSGLHAFCGAEFFEKLIDHKSIRDTYLATQAAADLRGEVADKFTYGGITFERYRTGNKAAAANGGIQFIASNKARVVVKGVPDLFIERYAPAPYTGTVNTIGLPRYSRIFSNENDTGYRLESQMNMIPICTQPKTLRELTLAA